VLFVGMLSGTYSSIFIATPVLTQLKEREPQYKALAKRVAVRETGGRSAARKAAAAAKATGSGRTRAASPAPVEPDDNVADDFDDGNAPQDEELLSDDVPAASVARGQPGRAYAPGPRQQPRRDGRSGSTRRRPAGKKKRR